jgi:hypothetical protein
MKISEEKINIPNPRDLLKRFDSQEAVPQSLALHGWQSIRKEADVRCTSLDTPTDMFVSLQEKLYSVCNAVSDTTQLRRHEKRGPGGWY